MSLNGDDNCVPLSAALWTVSGQELFLVVARSVRGPATWNALPTELRTATVCLDTFGKQLKTYLFESAHWERIRWHLRLFILRYTNAHIDWLTDWLCQHQPSIWVSCFLFSDDARQTFHHWFSSATEKHRHCSGLFWSVVLFCAQAYRLVETSPNR